jgi:hypothetical protein
VRHLEGPPFIVATSIPHQRVLVSAAQAMGMDIDQIGIGHVQGQNGDFVECRGLLEELLG